MDFTRKMWGSPHSLVGHCTPSVRTWTWFRTMLSPNWRHRFYWPYQFFEHFLLHIVSSTVTFYLWRLFFFEKFSRCRVQNIHRSFVGRTGTELSIPTTSLVLPRRLGLCPVVVPAEAHSGPRRVFWGKAAWGETPLHFAADNGHVAAAELLLAKGAAVDATSNSGPGPQVSLT